MSGALRLRRSMLQAGRLVGDRLGRPAKTYLRDRVEDYRRIWSAAANACGATWGEVAADVWAAHRDGATVRMMRGEIELDDPVTLAVAGRKALVHRLLRDAGLQVPEHRVFSLDDLAPAYELLSAHPEGVVVKPASDTAAGDGVSTHLRDRAAVRRAAVLASLYGGRLLVERMVPGESYRALVVGGNMLHVVCRRGPRVEGDGSSSVRALIVRRNGSRAGAGLTPLEVDPDCTYTLGWQGLEPDAVVPAGVEVLLRAVETRGRRSSEVRTVYNAVATDMVAPPVRASVEAAAEVLGSDFVGVDLITPDPSRPLSEVGGCINEVNTTPALHHHYDVPGGADASLAAEVLDLALRRRAARVRAAGATPAGIGGVGP